MRSLLSFLFILSISLFQPISVGAKRFVVVIDAGHGGKDFGAVRGEYKEKDINLGVALKLGEYIKENMSDVNVIYTRKTDVFVELNQRSAIANKAKANLFISIHTNSTGSSTTTASGAETYILGLARSKENLEVAKRENSVILMEDNYSKKYEGFNPKSPESYIIFEFMTNKYMEQSYEMAGYVQKEFRKSTDQKDKGIRQAGFLVLRKSGMPSLLVEVGFINNPKDGAYITSKSGQGEIAHAIFGAFKKYKREFDKKQGSGVVNSKDEKDSSDSIEQDEVLNVRSSKSETSSKSKSEKNIEYRVQFYTSTKKLSKHSKLFKGFTPAECFKDGKEYKYTYGSASNKKEAMKIRKKICKTFKEAHVLKFKNGVRID